MLVLRQDMELSVRANRVFNDVAQWRWTPCVALLTGTLLANLLIVLLVPDHIEAFKAKSSESEGAQEAPAAGAANGVGASGRAQRGLGSRPSPLGAPGALAPASPFGANAPGVSALADIQQPVQSTAAPPGPIPAPELAAPPEVPKSEQAPASPAPPPPPLNDPTIAPQARVLAAPAEEQQPEQPGAPVPAPPAPPQ